MQYLTMLWLDRYAVWGNCASLINKAKERGMSDAIYFDLMPQYEWDDIYYARTFTLKKDEHGNIMLYPDDNFVRRHSCVYSHNSVIFEGILPEMMLIAVHPNLTPKLMNDMLQLRIEAK